MPKQKCKLINHVLWKRVAGIKISMSRKGASLSGTNARRALAECMNKEPGKKDLICSRLQSICQSPLRNNFFFCKVKWQPYTRQSSGNTKLHEVTFNSHGAVACPAPNSWIIPQVINKIIRKISTDISRPWARLQAGCKCMTGDGTQTRTLHQAIDVIWEVNAKSDYDSTLKSANIFLLLNIIR